MNRLLPGDAGRPARPAASMSPPAFYLFEFILRFQFGFRISSHYFDSATEADHRSFPPRDKMPLPSTIPGDDDLKFRRDGDGLHGAAPSIDHSFALRWFLSGNGPFPQSLRQSSVLLVRRTMYVTAQYLDFLDLAKNCSFPNQKRTCVHTQFPDGHYASIVDGKCQKVGPEEVLPCEEGGQNGITQDAPASRLDCPKNISCGNLLKQ